MITIFRAADFAAPYSSQFCQQLLGDPLEAALCIHYQTRKIKNLALQTFDKFNLAADFQQIIVTWIGPLAYCPTLHGKRVIKVRTSHSNFYHKLALLERVLDWKDEAADIQLHRDIVNLDIDECIYNDVRLDDC
ncbi:hypothetical protein K503DRAFT_806446 [Rhizopogon vinicolor AM-OR11-026]|uniref:Uncharacterized protein n=1 Tax=Rhizopogon vinicolor AM-OR11-026 TaxID=1314800 RepID=A0A1B7MEK3_9AGAM|nr:hypothetical protein K503DRAFT_806446 [Rhizopogon vinicolor AM-OR11-026]